VLLLENYFDQNLPFSSFLSGERRRTKSVTVQVESGGIDVVLTMHQYEAIRDRAEIEKGRPVSSSLNCQIINTAIGSYSHLLIFVIGSIFGLLAPQIFQKVSVIVSQSQVAQINSDIVSFMHISDTHVDYFFNPNHSVPKGACHSCDLSHTCPKLSTIPKDFDVHLREQGYAFGRYGCNPPPLLFESLIQQMLEIDPAPPVIVFTGDISPHAYPDDYYEVTRATTVDELCRLKFDVTTLMIKQLVAGSLSLPGPLPDPPHEY
jgi:hypothetical protein